MYLRGNKISLGIARPWDCIMDPGQADSPNTQRDVPTVMGPVSSAANIDYLTPTTYQRQLPESSPATTISYVPAEELESSVQGREVPQTGSAASYSLNSPSHEDPLLPREGDQFVMDPFAAMARTGQKGHLGGSRKQIENRWGSCA